MNKDKSIKDLKQYNDKIKTQLEYSKARVWSLERENDRLTNELNICMIERNNFLSRIEKAVEYIENTPLYEITYDYNMEEELEIQNVSDETASNKLLYILNGRSDK